MMSNAKMITGLHQEFIQLLYFIKILKITLKNTQRITRVKSIIEELTTTRRMYLGNNRVHKFVKVDGKYYYDLFTPGWNTKALDRSLQGEVSRIYSSGIKSNRFSTVFLSITNRCPLSCEHCFEWDSRNQPDKLSLAQLKTIVNKFREIGVGQIQLTGGEPMLRIDDIIEIVKSTPSDTEFLLFTSGYNLTIENAIRLKEAGLAGVIVSLDNYNPSLHNKFRGHERSFNWATEAVKASVNAKLVTALSLCATSSFVTEENLAKYMKLARRLGVSFVQFLEPQAVGHYKGKDVALKPDKVKILEDFYFKMNHLKTFKTYPIVCYHAYHQHHSGCFGAGNRFMYVDADGDMNPCPFCREKTGNALHVDINNAAKLMQTRGCFLYNGITMKIAKTPGILQNEKSLS